MDGDRKIYAPELQERGSACGVQPATLYKIHAMYTGLIALTIAWVVARQRQGK
jgi:hypothetical protein